MSHNNLRLGLNPEPEKPQISILCVDISHQSQTVQFIICSSGVFIFFILYGYMQELIFTIEGFHPFGFYLTLVQFGYYTLFGLVETRLRNTTSRRIPIQTYFLLALLTLGTMGLSNASLGYLNYPTQVIFKCCKLIPVLAGSILIQGKRYGPLDFSAAVLMCVGLTLFTLADSHVQPNFNTRGITMISLALLCDAIIGNVQEKSMKNYGAPNCEVVLYSYSIGFFYLLIVMGLTGDLTEGLQFFATVVKSEELESKYAMTNGCQNPKKMYGYALLFSLTGYLGIQIVLTLVRTCGAFAAVTVTTCRKAMTIIISFLFFSKPFTFQYLWSGLLVVLGIYLNLYSNKHPVSMSDLEIMIERCLRSIKLKLYAKRYASPHYTANV